MKFHIILFIFLAISHSILAKQDKVLLMKVKMNPVVEDGKFVDCDRFNALNSTDYIFTLRNDTEIESILKYTKELTQYDSCNKAESIGFGVYIYHESEKVDTFLISFNNICFANGKCMIFPNHNFLLFMYDLTEKLYIKQHNDSHHKDN